MKYFYVVMWTMPYEGDDFLGVFSSLKKAQAYKFIKESGNRFGTATIIKTEMNKGN
jgi:hypothetical protein